MLRPALFVTEHDSGRTRAGAPGAGGEKLPGPGQLLTSAPRPGLIFNSRPSEILTKALPGHPGRCVRLPPFAGHSLTLDSVPTPSTPLARAPAPAPTGPTECMPAEPGLEPPSPATVPRQQPHAGRSEQVQHTRWPGPRAMVLYPRLKDRVAGWLTPPMAPLAPRRIRGAPQCPRS